MSRPGRIACLLLVLASSLLASPGGVRGDEPPEEPGVRRSRTDGALVVEVVLPGRLIGYATPRRADGSRDLLALVSPRPPSPQTDAAAEPAVVEPCPPAPRDDAASRPAMLVRVGYVDGTLRTLSDALPSDVSALMAADLDGDGADELLVARPGEVDLLPVTADAAPSGALEPVLRDPLLGDIGRGNMAATGIGGGRLVIAAHRLGHVSFFGLPSAGGEPGPIADVALPVSASRDDSGFMLRSPLVVRAGTLASGHPLFAAAPRRQGAQRLGTVLIDPLAAGDVVRTDVWSRLPGPERVLEAVCLLVDGRPALVVTTRPAHKLSFFGEKKLRLFFLDEKDRSRLGSAPALEVESRVNLWQRVFPAIVDVDADGREDLVLGYWKGLKDDRVVLDTYPAKPDGTFQRSPRTTAFDVEDADRGILGYGRDVDGDGTPDLILHAGGAMRIFRGDPGASRGKDLVGREPYASLPWPGGDGDMAWGDAFDIEVGDDDGGGVRLIPPGAGFGTIRFVDLDGDGHAEMLGGRGTKDGLGRLVLITPARRPGTP